MIIAITLFIDLSFIFYFTVEAFNIIYGLLKWNISEHIIVNK